MTVTPRRFRQPSPRRPTRFRKLPSWPIILVADNLCATKLVAGILILDRVLFGVRVTDGTVGEGRSKVSPRFRQHGFTPSNRLQRCTMREPPSGTPPVGRSVQQGWAGRNANLQDGTRRVGLASSVCLESLAAVVRHTRRVSRHVTVKMVTLRVPYCN